MPVVVYDYSSIFNKKNKLFETGTYKSDVSSLMEGNVVFSLLITLHAKCLYYVIVLFNLYTVYMKYI